MSSIFKSIIYKTLFVIAVIALALTYWRYENFKLIDRVNTALDNGQNVYAENIDSLHCVGLRYKFHKVDHNVSFKIYDQNGEVFNEKLFNSILGGCRRHRPYRVEWTNLSE